MNDCQPDTLVACYLVDWDRLVDCWVVIRHSQLLWFAFAASLQFVFALVGDCPDQLSALVRAKRHATMPQLSLCPKLGPKL